MKCIEYIAMSCGHTAVQQNTKVVLLSLGSLTFPYDSLLRTFPSPWEPLLYH